VLILRIADNGVGLDAGGSTSSAGIGIPSTRARLAALYGPRHRFALEDREGGGVTVTVSIPWRRLKENGGG
jgi:signal transduction histidine kinase